MDESKKWGWWSIGLFIAIALYLMFVAAGSGYVFLTLWPAQPVIAGASTGNVTVTILLWSWRVSEEVRVVGLVLTSGIIGAATYGLYAEFLHIARGDFNRRWTLWYFARPFVGAFFGLIFYLGLRGGLFSIGTPVSQLNLFVFSGLAALVGMFSEEALAKFKQIAESMLTKASFVQEEYVTGEKVPTDGTFVYVKHAPGATCTMSHVGVVKTPKKDENFPAPECGQAAIWALVRAQGP